MTNTPTPQRGRPPHEPESATSRIVMRVTQHRKGAYVRAANGEPLTEWATRHLDAAAKYKPDDYGGKCLRCCGAGYFGLDSTYRACGGTGKAR